MISEKTNSESRENLPKGWTWVRIGDIATKINPGFPSGKHNKEGRGIPHLRPMNISPKGEIDLTETKFVEVSDYDHLREGDILFNNTNSPALLGKTTYIRKDTNWAYSNHMTRIRLLDKAQVEPAWVAYGLHHLFETGFFRMHCRHHVNQASINTTFLAERVSLPLPPLPEQKRIVEKIEELLSQLDAGVAELNRVQANLARYKASLLKSACGGRLVSTEAELARAEGRDYESGEELLQRILAERKKKWEEEQRAKGKDPSKMKYQEPEPPDTEGLPGLPEGWVWASLEQLSWDSSYGTSQKCSYEADGPPVLRIPNIVNGGLDFSDIKYATEPKELSKDKAITQGDLLIIRTNGSRDLIGRSALVRDYFYGPMFFASYLIRYRIIPVDELPVWTNTIWDSFILRERIEGIAATTAGQYNVSVSKLNRLTIPLPPSGEQHRIITEVERTASIIQELEKVIKANITRGERLQQAILKQAFEGKLVPQDPEDEPASELLKKIRKEL